MPTASRLVAAVCFAAIAYFVSGLIPPLLPEGTQFGLFAYVNTALGVVLGWKITGSRTGEGMQTAIGAGLTTSLALVFWGLLVHSGVIMIENSTKMRYDGPMEAVVDTFNIGIEFAQIIATPMIIGTLVIGGIVAGILAELAGRRWA